MSAEAPVASSRDRAWWRRTVKVVRRPGATFAALEDTTPADEQARQEPLLAIVVLAGIGGTLMTTFAGRILDEQRLDAVELALWAFIGGAFDGFALYWILGALLYVGGVAAGSSWSYKQARHLLGFAAVPLALSLVMWPLRLALHGKDNFREGGADAGAWGDFFERVDLWFLAWSAVLLVLGIKIAHEWSWQRSLATATLVLLVPLLALLRAYGVV